MEFSNDQSPEEKAKSLYDAGRKARDEAQEHFAHAYFTQSLNLYRGLGDKAGTARALISLSHLVFHYNPTSEESWARRARLAKEALAIARKTKDKKLIIQALRAMAPVSRGETGMKLLEEGLKLARELDDQKEIANCQERMGAHLALSDAPRARQLKREAIELFRSIDDKKGLAQALFGLSIGWADHEERLAFAEESLALYREVGLKEQIAQGLMYIAGMVYNDGEDDDRAYVMHEEVRDICHEIGVSIWEASAIRSLADISERRGEANRTAELREQADRIHPEDPPNPEFMAALEKAAESSDNEAARQALGKAFFGKKP